MLVLASSSPRRRELLAELGVEFEVEAAEIDESAMVGEHPITYTQRLAHHKALAVFKRREASADLIVLGADTIVVLDEHLLGKPANVADAARMLRLLSGRTHQVMTGIALMVPGNTVTAVETTNVTFRILSEAEIAEYIATGEPMDKAGAYAIQGLGGAFVEKVDGDYSNVVGLPLGLLGKKLMGLRG